MMRLSILYEACAGLLQICPPIGSKLLLGASLFAVYGHRLKVLAYAKSWLNHTFSITSSVLPENRLDKAPQAETLVDLLFQL